MKSNEDGFLYHALPLQETRRNRGNKNSLPGIRGATVDQEDWSLLVHLLLTQLFQGQELAIGAHLWTIKIIGQRSF